MIAVEYTKALLQDGFDIWNRFWFEAKTEGRLSLTRMAIGLIAALYALSWIPDVTGWIGTQGAMSPGNSALLMETQGDMTFWRSIVVYRPSLLFSIHSSSAVIAYLLITVFVCFLLSLGIGGRWIAAASLVLTLGIIHRCIGMTGISEHLLATILAYLTVDNGRSTSWRPSFRLVDHQTTSAPIAYRLMQVHLFGWLIVSFISQQASLVWWQGEAMWYFAAANKSLVLSRNTLLQADWITNLATHFFVLIQILMLLLLPTKRTRLLGVVLLMVYWICIAFLVGETVYAIVGSVCSLIFIPRYHAAELRSQST